MSKGSKKELAKKRMSWNDMSPGRKVGVFVVGTVQLILAITAWRDLASRADNQVNGSKRLWAAIIAINWVGPIAYFVKGRRQDVPPLLGD
jgi:hypothetical protein